MSEEPTSGPVKIRVTVTVDVVDAAALTEAALAALGSAELDSDEDVDLDALAELRAAIPGDPSAAIVTLVDPATPLADIPGVSLLGVDVEVGTTLEDDEPEIRLP
jgi:hypothetical protein